MKCKACGCDCIEFTRFEEIGMKASEMLLERCKEQQKLIEELMEELKKYTSEDQS